MVLTDTPDQSTNLSNSTPLQSETLNNPTPLEFEIKFLCDLIPKEFTGNRYELGQFIANCNNADELASTGQKIPLLYFILSRISGHAKEQLALHKFNNWSELKERLKILYQDKKHYCQIMEDLNNCKQTYSEDITGFHQRLIKLSSRALGAIQQYASDPLEIPGKRKAVEEVTLNRFVYHSSPQISQMLRWKDFDNLNSAYSAAVSEERALNMYHPKRRKACDICRKMNHDTSQCRFKSSSGERRSVNTVQTPVPNQSRYQNNQYRYSSPNETNRHHSQSRFPSQGNSNLSGQTKFCNYCKNQGHLISECRKKAFNDSRREQSANQPSSSRQSDNKAVHSNCQESPVMSTAQEDQISHLQVFEN